MAARGIANDSTVETVVETMSKKVDYVVGVFGNLRRDRKAQGCVEILTRVGVTGTGKKTNYRTEAFDIDGNMIGDPKTYRGANHDALFEDNSDLSQTRWSTEAMTFEEVEALLGRLRGFTGKSAHRSQLVPG